MAPLLRLLSICIGVAPHSRVAVGVALLGVGLDRMLLFGLIRFVPPRLFDRRRRSLRFVGEAAFSFRDLGDFLRVLF
jgi:hypothetical protein